MSLTRDPNLVTSMMPTAIAPVTTKAMKLSPKQRMGLATLLLDSLENEVGVEKKLLLKLTKRAAELRSGKVTGLSTEAAYGFSL